MIRQTLQLGTLQDSGSHNPAVLREGLNETGFGNFMMVYSLLEII